MPSNRPRPFAWDALLRALRFFYLLWGGMLLGTHAMNNRVRVPSWVWQWPEFARFWTTPWGRGVLMGLGLAMALAALFEVWELVDRLLARLLRDREREH